MYKKIKEQLVPFMNIAPYGITMIFIPTIIRTDKPWFISILLFGWVCIAFLQHLTNQRLLETNKRLLETNKRLLVLIDSQIEKIENMGEILGKKQSNIYTIAERERETNDNKEQ